MRAKKASTKQVRSTHSFSAYLGRGPELIPTALCVINNNFSALSLMIIHCAFLEWLRVSDFALGFSLKILPR